MKTELYSALPYYHSVRKKHSNSVKYIIRMDDDIDGDAFARAVNVSLQRYPYFKVKVVRNIVKSYLVPNDAPVVIVNSKESVRLGGPEANWHLMAFGYWENNIYIYNFHGLMDGRGRGPFMKTLMYYYCTYRYGEKVQMEDVNLADSPVDPQELVDPFTGTIPKGMNIKPLLHPLKCADLSRLGKVTPDATRYRLLKLPEDEFIEWCKAHDATPNSAISLLMARAVKEVHPDLDEKIIAGVCCDLRAALGNHKSYNSLIYFLHLVYGDKIATQDLDTQLTEFRGQMILLSDTDELRLQCQAFKALFKIISMLPSILLKRALSRMVMDSIYNGFTFGVSYTGKVSYGSCNAHITGLYSEPNTTGAGIFIEITAADGYIMLTFAQEWKEDVYFDALCKQFSDNGLKFSIVYRGLSDVPEVDPRGNL